MPARAVHALTSQPLAPNDATTEAMLRAQFPPAMQARVQLGVAAPPANETDEESVIRAIRSISRGSAAGPSGLRPDFLRQLVEQSRDTATVKTMASFVNLLLDGQAPLELSQWIADAAGYAIRKRVKASGQGAAQTDPGIRPVCCGEAWRRVTCKCGLATETTTIADYLRPWQLAVGVQGGAEALVHAAREWQRRAGDDVDLVLLNFDEVNAYNEVDRSTFLKRMEMVTPGLARWLRYLYPLEGRTWVVWNGQKIPSERGGHQGCPMMSVCHAAVQRAIPEALGLAELWPGTEPLLPLMQPPPTIDAAAPLADDGFVAGPSNDIYRVAVHMRAHMPDVGLRFGTMQAVLAAGPRSVVDRQMFDDIGCQFLAEGNWEAMRAPLGDLEYAQAYIRERAKDTLDVIEALSKLSSPHTAFYLMRYQIRRTNYIMRFSPAEFTRHAMAGVDACAQALVQSWVGSAQLDEAARIQYALPQRYGGLGLPSCQSIADAAYLASRHQADDLVKHLLKMTTRTTTTTDVGDDDDISTDPVWEAAKTRYAIAIAEADHDLLASLPVHPDDDVADDDFTQRALTRRSASTQFLRLWNQVGEAKEDILPAPPCR